MLDMTAVLIYLVMVCDQMWKGRKRDISSEFSLNVTQWRTQKLFRGGSTNSVEDREQREQGSGGGNPLVRGSAQFANG
jgi:hypothetical protein